MMHRGETPKSPVHIHVKDTTPVHVHVQKPIKPRQQTLDASLLVIAFMKPKDANYSQGDDIDGNGSDGSWYH